MASRSLSWILTVLALVGIASSQALWDGSAKEYRKEAKRSALLLAEPALPSVTALKALSINQRPVLADLLWLKTIQYFGVGNPYGRYPSLGAILDTITQLDPKFQYPYEFGMIVLPFMEQTETAIKIGERAQTAIPNNGLLTFYLASDYHLNVKDYKRAGDLYAKAANEPGAPGAARELAGVAYASNSNSLSDRLVALAFWKTAYENATEESEQDRALNWFKHMEIVYAIELSAQTFKEKTGTFPVNIQDLVDAGYFSEYPVSPIGRTLILDPKTGRVDFTRLKPIPATDS